MSPQQSPSPISFEILLPYILKTKKSVNLESNTSPTAFSTLISSLSWHTRSLLKERLRDRWMLGFAAGVGKGREEGGLGRRGVWADR